MPWGRFTSPMALFYHMDIFLSITLNDFTDCLFGYGDSIAAIYSPVETRTYLLRLIRAFAFRHVLLLECFAFGSRLSLQFCCNVLPSVHAGYAVLSKCLAFGSRLLFAAKRQTGRLARRCVPIPPWVGIAGSAFSDRRCGYPDFLVHFGLARFLWRRSRRRTKETRRTEGRGERSRRRGFCALLRNRIGLVILSAGSTLGLRAPNLRQRVFDSLDSLHAAAGLP